MRAIRGAFDTTKLNTSAVVLWANLRDVKNSTTERQSLATTVIGGDVYEPLNFMATPRARLVAGAL